MNMPKKDPNTYFSASPDATGFDAAFAVPFRYRVRFTHSAFDVKNETIRSLIAAVDAPVRMLAFVDAGVASAWPTLLDDIRQYSTFHRDVIELAHEPEVLSGGEFAKNNRDVVDSVLRAIEAHAICRQSIVLAIGGGAMLDAVGFAAATAHRGVRLVRLPTTTLSQADAGVGVKNGINAFGKKNFIGCFAPPWAIVNDERFLTTLSDREWRAGLAEAIKVALLKDAAFFADIESAADALAQRDNSAASRILRRAAELHIEHIVRGGDPFETQSARPLDFGHWSAHKLEEMSGFRIRHGEAVAIGVALDTLVSTMDRRLPESDAQRILTCIATTGLPLYHMLLENLDALREGIEQFRQHMGGRLTITLLDAIARPIDVHHIDFDAIRKAVGYLASYVPARGNLTFSLDEPIERRNDRNVRRG